MAKRRKRLKIRFFLIVFLMVGVVVMAVLIVRNASHRNEIKFGSIDAALEVSGTIIRDETIVMTEPYEKVAYAVIEGQTLQGNELVAQVYKRGYQDETMISLLNLQKQIYNTQLALLGGSQPQELIDINENIATVEAQIRSTARGETNLDMLTLEQTLKALLTERITFLSGVVTGDASLSSMYAELSAQQSTQQEWRRDILNTCGAGVVSFYFDGYERALSASKLSTVNAALVNTVVKGGNTASNTDSTSELPLYRVVNTTHWYYAFVTKSADAMRLAEGETYYVTFPDFSDQAYTAVAMACTTSENNVVNMLEFHTDIGKMIGTRVVTASISKAAQGLIVPLDAIDYVGGVPGLNIQYGDSPLRVEIEILASDEKNAVVRARSASDALHEGQKYIKP